MPNKSANMLLSWDKNLDPDLKTCSASAVYSRDTKQPSGFHGRLYFWNIADARMWADKLPKFVGVRVKVFRAKRINVWHDLGQISIDINMAGRKGFTSENGINRYHRFINTVLDEHYKIDWQSPSYVLRAYRDRAAFEAALKPAPIRQYKDNSDDAEPYRHYQDTTD